MFFFGWFILFFVLCRWFLLFGMSVCLVVCLVDLVC